jgi:hypothetical protein
VVVGRFSQSQTTRRRLLASSWSPARVEISARYQSAQRVSLCSWCLSDASRASSQRSSMASSQARPSSGDSVRVSASRRSKYLNLHPAEAPSPAIPGGSHRRGRGAARLWYAHAASKARCSYIKGGHLHSCPRFRRLTGWLPSGSSRSCPLSGRAGCSSARATGQSRAQSRTRSAWLTSRRGCAATSRGRSPDATDPRSRPGRSSCHEIRSRGGGAERSSAR